jgi:hypothetical protein
MLERFRSVRRRQELKLSKKPKSPSTSGRKVPLAGRSSRECRRRGINPKVFSWLQTRQSSAASNEDDESAVGLPPGSHLVGTLKSVFAGRQYSRLFPAKLGEPEDAGAGARKREQQPGPPSQETSIETPASLEHQHRHQQQQQQQQQQQRQQQQQQQHTVIPAASS